VDATNYGKETKIPDHRPAPIGDVVTPLQRMIYLNWGAKKLATLSKDEKIAVRQKIVTYDLFKGQKAYDIARVFKANYLREGKDAPNYDKAVQALFVGGGDTAIVFADDVIKVNRKGAMQHQCVIVTDKHIYKYTPGSFKMIKQGEPISNVQGVYMSKAKEPYMVIAMKSPSRDMVLDLGTNGCERYSELTTILVTDVPKFGGSKVKVEFKDQVPFNNSRTASSSGQAHTLTFVNKGVVPKGPKNPSGATFSFGSKGTAIINYE